MRNIYYPDFGPIVKINNEKVGEFIQERIIRQEHVQAQDIERIKGVGIKNKELLLFRPIDTVDYSGQPTDDHILTYTFIRDGFLNRVYSWADPQRPDDPDYRLFIFAKESVDRSDPSSVRFIPDLISFNNTLIGFWNSVNVPDVTFIGQRSEDLEQKAPSFVNKFQANSPEIGIEFLNKYPSSHSHLVDKIKKYRSFSDSPMRNTLSSVLSEIEREQAQLLDIDTNQKDWEVEFLKRRIEFLSERGIDLLESSGSRLETVKRLIHQRNPDFEAALILHDTRLEGTNLDWLLMIGYLYDREHNNPLFNPTRSRQIYTVASALGSWTSAFNIGLKYKYGHENEVDNNKAMFWFDEAIELGEAGALSQKAHIQQYADTRYGRLGHEEFTASVLEGFKKAEAANHPWTINHLAYMYAGGRGVEKQPDEAVKRYKKLVEMDISPAYVSEKVLAIFTLVVRSIIGLDAEQDFSVVRDLLSKRQIDTNDIQVTSKFHHLFEKVDEVIAKMNGSKEYKNDFLKATEIIRNQNSSWSDTYIPPVNEAMIDSLELVCLLALKESWREGYKWARLLEELQFRNLGLQENDLIRSTFMMGPTYNPISKNGLPVLGVWRQPENIEEHGIDKRAYVPSTGISSFQGLEAKQDGNIDFICVSNEELPSLLMPEDFEVCVALVFGYPEREEPRWPSLSLEKGNHFGIEDNKEVISFKIWDPEWLGYTSLGRTMYITDNLIGSLCWMPDQFQIGSPDQCFTPSTYGLAKDLVDEITWAGGRIGAGQSRRVMLKPIHVSIKPDFKEARDATVRLTVQEVKMGVDGSYVLRKKRDDGDIEENRLVSLNDPSKEQGRKTKILTDRYDDIAVLMPVFERARQIMGVLYTLAELKNIHEDDSIDFRLNDKIQRQALETRRAYEELPTLSSQELACLSLPVRTLGG